MAYRFFCPLGGTRVKYFPQAKSYFGLKLFLGFVATFTQREAEGAPATELEAPTQGVDE